MISQASWNWEANRQNALKSEDSPALVEKINSTNNKAPALSIDEQEIEDKYIHKEKEEAEKKEEKKEIKNINPKYRAAIKAYSNNNLYETHLEIDDKV